MEIQTELEAEKRGADSVQRVVRRAVRVTPRCRKRTAGSLHPVVMPLGAIREAIRQTRDDHTDVIAMMPNKATTAGQRALKKKHGTPRAFARAVVNAIGEISVLEANLAIRKYRDEWQAA